MDNDKFQELVLEHLQKLNEGQHSLKHVDKRLTVQEKIHAK